MKKMLLYIIVILMIMFTLCFTGCERIIGSQNSSAAPELLSPEPSIPISCNDHGLYYEGNGGEGFFAVHFYDGSRFPYTISYPGNTFFKEGHIFKYWNTEADGSGTTYMPGDILDGMDDLSFTTLYAIWEENDVLGAVNDDHTEDPVSTPTPHNNEDSSDTCSGSALEYNANGGEGHYVKFIYGNELYTYTINAADQLEIFRDGYSFKCWNTKPDGSGKNYYPDDEIFYLFFVDGDFVSKQTLYAVWEADHSSN